MKSIRIPAMKKVLFLLLFIAASKARAFEMVATGWSMYPTLPYHSIINVNGLIHYEDLKPGMIVVFYSHIYDNYTNHRLIKHHTKGILFDEGWITKGDNNKELDPGLMTKRDFMGVIVGYRPYPEK
jgi:signal peptidase I